MDGRVLACLGILALCGGCGSGGGTSGPGVGLPTPDVAGPEATVWFPAPSSVTDRDVVTVVGTAIDPSGIASLTVNGVPAVTHDRYARWTAQVPLAPGDNVFAIESTDLLGNTTSLPAALVVRSVGPFVVGALDVDLGTAEAVVLDGARRSLVAADLATGMRRTVSDDDVGTGPALVAPRELVVSAAGTDAWVLDGALGLVRVDLLTGDRTVVSAPGGGGLSGLYPSARALAVDETAQRAFVVVQFTGLLGVYSIDLTDGSTGVISNAFNGSGDVFLEPTGIESDPTGARLYVSDADQRGVLVVDPATGNRELLSGLFDGEGPLLARPRAPRLDATAGVLYVVDPPNAALVAIDTTTGDRTVVSDATHGSGPPLASISGLALDLALGRALVCLEDAVIAVDLATGERSALSETRQGFGPTLDAPSNAYGHVRQGKVVVQENGVPPAEPAFTLTSIDVRTGDRTVVASSDSGTGVEVVRQYSFECDRRLRKAIGLGHVLIGTELELAVYEIDLQTSNRTLLHVLDSAPVVLQHADVEYDGSNSIAFAAFEDEIWRVDLKNDSSQLISGPGVGTGVELLDIRRIALDLVFDRLVVSDNGLASVVFVDPVGGHRVPVTGALLGGGPIPAQIGAISVDARRRNVLFADEDDGSLLLSPMFSGKRSVLLEGGTELPLVPVRDVVVDPERNLAYGLLGGDVHGLLLIEMETKDRVLISR